MKRRTLLILLLVTAVGALAAGGYFGYAEFVRLRGIEEQLAAISSERDALALKVSASSADRESAAARLADAGKKAALYDAIKLALGGDVALQVMEKSVKDSKSPTAEQYLALGGLRLLKAGEGDAESVAAFERALELANWPAAKKLTCAAQIGITVAGKQTELAADCGGSPSPVIPRGGADERK
jgi:hypothetical protein